MAITVSVTEDVTTLSVTDSATSVSIAPSVTQLGVVNVPIAQSNVASGISSAATGHISSTNVQAALAELASNPEFTTALKNKLDAIEEEANKLTAGTNISISNQQISADVLGALSAGSNITISDQGVISATSVSLTDVYTAASESAQLSLSPTPNQGDVVIRTDENKTYIHNGGTAGTMADYTELASNTNGVQSINGETGAVTFGKSDLDGYVANEFIDWTTSQTANIHADNYTNTTYTAGTGISITNDVISATGAAGSSLTAGNGIAIDNSTISFDSNDLIAQVKFSNNSNTDSGISITSFPKELYSTALDFSGLAIYFDDPTDNEDSILVAGITRDLFFFDGAIDSDNLLIGSAYFAIDSEHTDIYDTSTLIGSAAQIMGIPPQGTTIPDVWMGNVGVTTQTATTNDYTIANTAFVQNAINDLSADIPNITTYDDSLIRGVYKRGSDYLVLQPSPLIAFQSSATDNVANTLIFDPNLNKTVIGQSISGSGAVSVSVTSTGLVISANNDGLPTQSSSTVDYVLQSDGTNAQWADLTAASLPTQTGNSGKYLTTNGTTASWADVDAYPSQTGNQGKFLTTNGTSVSWDDVDALPAQNSSTNGKVLSSNGSTASWTTPTDTIPAQANNQQKFLTTDGSTLSWSTINTAGQTGNITFSNSTVSSSDTNTVTVDDNLTATGTVTADSLDINGAGNPTITSAGSIAITAPDGVTINNGSLPLQQIVVALADIPTTTWLTYSGWRIQKEATDGTTRYIKLEKTTGTGDFVQANYVSTSDRVVASVRTSSGDLTDTIYYIDLTNLDNNNVPNGTVKIEILDV